MGRQFYHLTPRVSLGKYTIVQVINVAAIMLSSWSTCVIFQLWQSQVIPSPQFIIGFVGAICNRSVFTGLCIMQSVHAVHINMLVLQGNLHDALFFFFFRFSSIDLCTVCFWTCNTSNAPLICKIRFYQMYSFIPRRYATVFVEKKLPVSALTARWKQSGQSASC